MFHLDMMILRLAVILPALTIHECAHGWVALRFGDRTALNSGRLTLNPVSHLDILGTVMLLFGPMGWAKPVPVNPYNLHNPRRDIIFVSLAGPISNILLALVFGFAVRLTYGTLENMPAALSVFTDSFLQVNFGLALFNLLPIVPLDGSKVLMGFLSRKGTERYLHTMKYVPRIFLTLLVIEWGSSIIGYHIPAFSMLFMPIFNPFMNFWYHLIF